MTSGIVTKLKSVFVMKAAVAVSLSPSNVSAMATTAAAGDIAIAIMGARYTYSLKAPAPSPSSPRKGREINNVRNGATVILNQPAMYTHDELWS